MHNILQSIVIAFLFADVPVLDRFLDCVENAIFFTKLEVTTGNKCDSFWFQSQHCNYGMWVRTHLRQLQPALSCVFWASGQQLGKWCA